MEFDICYELYVIKGMLTCTYWL